MAWCTALLLGLAGEGARMDARWLLRHKWQRSAHRQLVLGHNASAVPHKVDIKQAPLDVASDAGRPNGCSCAKGSQYLVIDCLIRDT